MTARRERTITGRHVLIAMVVFFGIVLAANGAFVLLSLRSWTGLSTEDAYQRGLDHNETLRAAEAQRALGWQTAIEVTSHGAGRGRIEVVFHDSRGDPLEHLSISGELRRPTHEGSDQAVVLARSGPGRYRADVALPLAGQWDLRLSARSPAGAQYRLEERIWLK